MMRRILKILAGAIALMMPTLGFAEMGFEAFSATINDSGDTEYHVTIQVLAIMTMLAFLPAMLMMLTSFTRIIIVFSILRQALGLQQAPSNQILIGMAMFLTFFIMKPVFDQINVSALTPYMDGKMGGMVALEAAKVPIMDFMLANTRESDISLFMKMSETPNVESVRDVPFHVLVPAFVTSELKTAFQIGFMLFVPFLIIDLVVASILMAMGMMMLSPVIVSLPFKIMLFVIVDGWAMLMGTLAASYGI
jgi:flagellar biosynthetic protein FliP